jgi:hypothetical protein
MERQEKNRKAVLFGGTAGHGVVMTAVSQKNLEAANYQVKRECIFEPVPSKEQLKKKKYHGTSTSALFWSITLPNYNFNDVRAGDIVVIIDLPVGVDELFPGYTPDAAIRCIRNLTARQVNVVIIDHHKMADTYLGALREAGATIIISSSAVTSHYGVPTCESLYWGRIGAICDRDHGELPISAEEEALSQSLDEAIRKTIPETIEAIWRNDKEWFSQFNSGIPEPERCIACGDVMYIPEITPQWGFKQLGKACATHGKDYAIGSIGTAPPQTFLVVTHWESGALPCALRLGLTKWSGHPDAIFIKYEPGKLDEWTHVLNSKDPGGEIRQNLPELDPYKNMFVTMSAFMRKVDIPFYLTLHGWPHVENVLSSARTLGYLFSLDDKEKYLLDWAVLLHDVGRGAHEVYGVPKSVSDDKHHEFSAQMITEWAEKGFFKNFLTDSEVEIVRDICLRHRKNMDLPDGDERARLLCAILKVADAMDIDKRRAQKNDKEEFFEHLKNRLTQEQIRHWLGHRGIQSLRVHVKGEAIEFEFIITNPENAAFQVGRFQEEVERLRNYRTFEVREIHVVS